MKRVRIRWGRVLVALIILIIIIVGVVKLFTKGSSKEKEEQVQIVDKSSDLKDTVAKQIEEVVEKEVKEEEPIKEEPKVVEEVKVEVPRSKQYRLTSYYPEEGETCTGSGKCINNFQVNSKGWYTYNGKLVIAAATQECLRSHYGACNKWNTAKAGRKYFRYYEEIKIVIDGTTYDAIVLDSCGASMYLTEDRIDLFVSSSSYAIDRGYKGRNMVTVYADYS